MWGFVAYQHLEKIQELKTLARSHETMERQRMRERNQSVLSPSASDKVLVVSRLMRWLPRWIRREASAYRFYRSQELSVSEAMLYRVCALVPYSYSMVRSFALAHALLFVSQSLAQRRMTHCVRCPHRILSNGSHYCNANKCRCPRKRWWLFSKMTWWIRLTNVKCPIGHWQRWKVSDPSTEVTMND